MKVTIVLEDEGLCAALEQLAEETGRSVEDIAIQALEMWQSDMRSVAEWDAETATYEAKLREKGGVEAYMHAYLKMLEEDKDELRLALCRLSGSGDKGALEFLELLREQDRWVAE